MKLLAAVLILLFFTSISQALECGLNKVRNEHLKQTIEICLGNNKTLEKIWDIAIASSESESDSSSSESETPMPLQSMHEPSLANLGKIGRIKRALRKLKKEEKNTTKEVDNKNTEKTTEENTEEPPTTETPMVVSQNCMIHCVLEQKELVDDDGFPAHSKLLEELMKSTSNREVRDFLQDSTDECFQEVEHGENDKDVCAYSSDLVKCLAEKGRSNCADWPVADLPF